MALLQCNLYSQALKTNTEVNIIIPTPNSGDYEAGTAKNLTFSRGEKFQVLYLLHGLYGNYADWLRKTRIEWYADQHQIAVVMPSVGRSFYHDMVHGPQYESYVVHELPDLLKRVLPISGRREDTYIAGLSMGGYGCMYLGLKYPEKYGAIGALSGCLDIALLADHAADYEMDGRPAVDIEAIAGENAALKGSGSDCFALAARLLQEQKPVPEIFFSCGTEDPLFEHHVRAREEFDKLGLPYTAQEHPGVHNWDYWDTHIVRVLDWLDDVRRGG
ncbi:alpha/beta hydrolase family protein [Anaerolentibacter hominis]|uniref:alpha/beta hydrolase n=1 Tax=Anaerolentibacter hominis TaxID=3079009 RepID=UPI0031B7EDD1